MSFAKNIYFVVISVEAIIYYFIFKFVPISVELGHNYISEPQLYIRGVNPSR